MPHPQRPQPKLLVTGASGLLGWYLSQAASNDWEVYGTYHQQPIVAPDCRPMTAGWPKAIALDLTDTTALQECFAQLRPDAVIHTAALSQPNACQEHPTLSYKINVLASFHIAIECQKLGIPCVFTSSEQVFDGSQAPYREGDPPNPINRYGEHKALAESGMLARHDQMAVCRMPLMFGVVPHADSFIQPFIQRLRSGQLLQAFTDEIRMPLSGWDAAQGLLLALGKHRGILHLGGKERLSRYDMAKTLVEVLGIESALIEPCLQADVKMAAPRPADLSMDCTIAHNLGFDPGDFRSGLWVIRDRL